MVIQGSVDHVIDGDTVVCHLVVLPELELHGMHVRIQGINAPEINTSRGRLAKQFLENVLHVNSRITLKTEKRDKYGRVLGFLFTAAGENVGQLMMSAGFAEPYNP